MERELRDADGSEAEWNFHVYFAARSGARIEAFSEQAEYARSWSGSRYDLVVALGGWNSNQPGRPIVPDVPARLMRVLKTHAIRLGDAN